LLRRLYHVLAWLALANLFAAGGLVGYLLASGRLNAERVEQIAIVLRGDFPKPEVAASRPADEQQPPETSREELARLEAQRRFYGMISERRQRELDDRRNLNQVIQLDVNRQLEQIREKEQEFNDHKRQTEQALEQSGFQQALDMYSEMDPKLAKDVLLTKKDADVVQIFTQMDSIRRKKIVNSCKTPEEKAWIARVLTQISILDESGGGPPASGKAGDAAVTPTAP